jgi:quercetin dioxygenase-like cupin family protein
MIVEMTVARGSGADIHSHPNDEIGYVSSGGIRVEIGEESRELAAGDTYCAPAGEMHALRGREDSVCIVVFAPLRTEYMD